MNIFDPQQLALFQIDPEENASLETLLTKNNMSLPKLLQVKNIQPKIRSNFTYFIKHCQKNQDFCFKLIDIGIKCPLHEAANDNQKQACYIATDVLTSDQDAVADLLILPDNSKPKKKDSGNQSEQFQEIQQNIQTQAVDSPELQQLSAPDASLTDQEKFTKKYKYLIRILEYIGQQQPNTLDQNCINYMIKSINCVLRKKAEEFLEFLEKRPEILQKLIELNKYSSISQFLIKILSDDEIQGPNAETIKNTIIEGALKQYMNNITEQDFADRLEFLDQLFQTNKYASQDDRTELQKLSDIFTSQKTIQFFYQHLRKPANSTVFSNAVFYLIFIVKRMNVDEEIDPYSYSNEPKQETMAFQVDILYKEFPSILREGHLILNELRYSEAYKQRLVETRFYELLVLLTKNSRFMNCQSGKPKQLNSILEGNNIILMTIEKKSEIVKQLLKQFTNQNKNGINRICLITIIQKVLNLQIYQANNHQNDNIKTKSNQISEDQTQNKNEPVQKINENGLNKSQEKEGSPSNNQQEEALDGQEKKKKINKIKAGLKLNIKKFSHELPSEIQEQKKQPQTKKQVTDDVKRRECSFRKDEVLDILGNFSEKIQGHPELASDELKKKEKNNETQFGALINKILMILSNRIDWSQYQQEIVWTQKQNYIKRVESMFPQFNFNVICDKYSVTLATTKHPNASAKQKTNPELTFTNQFFKVYLKSQATEKPRQNKEKNFELSDSDFKSDDDQEIHAVKCTIQDLQNQIGFKIHNQLSFKTQNHSQKQTQPVKKGQNNETTQKNGPKQLEQQQTYEPKQKQMGANIKTQLLAQSNRVEIAKEKPVYKQKKPEVKSEQKNKANQQNYLKEQTAKPKSITFEFYVKHPLILV